jgi:hypothetical protein
MPKRTADDFWLTDLADDDCDDDWRDPPERPLDVVLREFWARRDYRSFRALSWSMWPKERLTPEMRRDCSAAIWCAAESDDWRLRAKGISALDFIPRHLARRADVIVAGLQARQKSVRSSACWEIGGLRLTRLVLARLERTPPGRLLNFDVLMAVGYCMTETLVAPRDDERLVAFVRGLERQPRIPGLVAWAIGQALYCDCPRHLDLEPDDDSIDADYWREYRRYPRPVDRVALYDFHLEPDAGYGRHLRRMGTGDTER